MSKASLQLCGLYVYLIYCGPTQRLYLHNIGTKVSVTTWLDHIYSDTSVIPHSLALIFHQISDE